MDNDYASKATDRPSVSGGAIICGAGVNWFSGTHIRCVTLSNSEAAEFDLALVL